MLRLNVIFRRISRCELGDGSMVCFWDDLWTDSELSQEYPRLASFAINGDISLMDAMQAEDLDSLFFHPLSQQAFEEFENLQAQPQLLPYNDAAVDRWVPILGNRYTSRRFYSQVFSNVQVHPVFKAIWKSKCTPRIKFFAWLVLVD